MIATNNLKKQYGKKVLFEGVSVKFKEESRYGLIGANGTGKSTFLNILTGQEESTAGEVIVDQGQRVSYLRQDHYAFDDQLIMDTVLQGYDELWKVHHERELLLGKEDLTDEEGIKASELEMEYADLDGYMAESNAGELLEGLGIPSTSHYEKMSSLTGGFKLRVLLARALFGKPDILLLDEPTNHLDIESISWLERFLSAQKGTVIVISHDRHFLNTICTHVADLDYNAIQLFKGNYDEYMEAASMARDRQIQQNEKKKKEIARLQEFVNRFSANASKAKQATARQKLIDKIQVDKIKPSSRKSPYIRFNIEKPCGKKVLLLENISFRYDDDPYLFKDFSLQLEQEDKIAIVGPNGIGKTTLVKLILGQLSPTEGQVTWGESANHAYFPQDSTEVLKGDHNLLEWLRLGSEKEMGDTDLRGLLGRMLFKKEDAFKKLEVLSGGERARLIISKMIMEERNVLIFDEPTNHLDLESIESLNYALEEYKSPIIFVSHDRQFVSSLANRIIEIKDNQVSEYLGNYEDYLKTKN